MSASYYHVPPRTTTYYYTYYHVLPRTTTYYHVLPRTTTYYHVLPHTTTYYHVPPRTTAKHNFCISGSHPCMSALLFYCSTSLLFYYFTPHTVLPRPMFGVGGPRCKKVCASRTATLRCRPRTTTYYHILLRTIPRTTTYYHVLPCTTTYTTTYYHVYYHVLPRTTTYYHVLPRTTAYYHVLPRTNTYYPRTTTYHHVLQQNMIFASRAATLACRPSYSTVLLVYCFTILLHIQYCRGRCLGLAARDAKKFVHRGQPLLDVGLVLPRTTTYYHVLPHITT